LGILKRHINKLILLFACIANSFFIFGQDFSVDQKFIITKRMLSVEDGLPSRLVFDAVQDQDGFMWFATSNGLCRYDGKSFKIYNTQNTPLPSNLITRIAIDAANHLFIQSSLNYGTLYPENKIQVLDLNTNRFVNINEAITNISFNSDQFNFLFHDELGNIFFLTDQRTKIWQYSKNSTLKLRKDFQKVGKDSTPVISFTSLLSASNNSILIRNYENNQPDYCIYTDTTLLIENSRFRPCTITDNKQILLFDEISGAFLIMDSTGNRYTSAFTESFEKEKAKPVNFYGQTQLFKSSQNIYYLLADNEWVSIYISSNEPKSSDFSVSNYFKDRLGNYWFCTEKGIYQLNVIKNQFEHFASQIQKKVFINNSVRSIYVENNKAGERNIYAMVNYDLILKGKEEKKIKNSTGQNMLKKNDLLYIAGNPLLTYNTVTGQIKSKRPYPNIGETWSLVDFSDSLLLIGGSSNIVKYNINTGNAAFINYVQKDIPIPQNVYRIIKTKKKGFVAVAENGIYFISDQCDVFDYYGKDQINIEKRLSFTGIYDFYEDKNGIVWLAMNGDGLIRWNWNVPNALAAEHFKKFSVENGLPDNILYRIEEDNSDNLWISSYSGLLRFNKKNFSTKIYHIKDGLANTEFNRISSFKDAQGWMYFGGMNGIDMFDPEKLNIETKEIIVSFQLIGLSKYSSAKDTIVDISEELKEQKEIVMIVGDKFLSVSFSLLDYQDRPHRYAYKIDGQDKDWNYVNENVIRISGLPYGKLKLHIKAQLESGNWNLKEIVIPITVIKPFYLEGWFYVSLFFILLFIFMLIYLLRVNKLQKDKSRLESLVQKRTNSLSEALEERELLLKEIHHRVKNNLQVITGLLQLQKEELQDESAQEAINEGQSRVSSIALIHQNLYQHKDLGNIAFKTFLFDLSNQIAELFKKDNKNLLVQLNLSETFIDIDTAVPLGLIVNELLTNSYKYAFQNHNAVIVSITLIEKEKGHYEMVYHDNGPGIKGSVDFKNAITLGIKLISGLTEQLLGTVDYAYNNGSEFTFHFKDAAVRKKEK